MKSTGGKEQKRGADNKKMESLGHLQSRASDRWVAEGDLLLVTLGFPFIRVDAITGSLKKSVPCTRFLSFGPLLEVCVVR